MPGRTIKMFFLALAVAAVAVPAVADNHQGSYTAYAQYVRAVDLSGTVRVNLGGRGTATISLRRIEEVRANGPLQVVPAPSQQSTSDVPMPVLWEGCIKLKVGSKVDRGCNVVTPAVTLELDPAINEGTLAFSVKSRKFEERMLFATVLLTGQGAPSGVPEVTPEVTPGPPDNNSANVTGAAGVFRAVTAASGSVRSEVLGGGAIINTRSGEAFQGVIAHWDGDTNCPIFAELAGGCVVD